MIGVSVVGDAVRSGTSNRDLDEDGPLAIYLTEGVVHRRRGVRGGKICKSRFLFIELFETRCPVMLFELHFCGVPG